MVKAELLILREVRLPLVRPFVTASGVKRGRRILLLEVRTSDGHSAWSECVAQETPSYSPETIDTAWMALTQWLVPLVREPHGSDPSDLRRHLDAHVSGHLMAKATLEMAWWDLQAQREERALARALGGSRERAPVGVVVGIHDDPESLVRTVGERLDSGYQKVKLKIRPGADVEYVAAVRSAFGPTAPLSVDANGAYGPADFSVFRRLDTLGLDMIEQPLPADDLVGHAELQQELGTPICLDESVTSLGMVRTLIRLGSARVVNVKPGRVGGLGAAVAIHDLCAAHGVSVWVGGMLESGIGRAYNIALASLPNFSVPGDISPSGRYWRRDLVTPEWTMTADGFVKVPMDRTGLGVEIDRDFVDEITVRAERFELD